MASAPKGYRLLTDDVWSRLIKLASKGGPGLVAVPYFGTGGAKLLPLAKGSRLVVNCSEAAVKAGQVNPSELLTLLRRGVEIHSSPNLHAKVFVFRSRAIVGSANVSEHSRTGLLEAGIETSNRAMVRSCREFVRSLLGDELGEETLKRLAGHYRPPRMARGSRAPQPKPKIKHSPVWVVRLMPEEWDAQTSEIAREAHRAAEKRIKDPSAFRLDQFRWTGSGLDDWRRGDRLIRVIQGARGAAEVFPPARVLEVRRFVSRRGRVCLVTAEVPKRKRAKPLKVVRRLLGNPRVLHGNFVRRRLRNEDVLAAISKLWNPR